MASKVALQYGVLTGERVGRPFIAALQKAGFEITSRPESADIIIGHSGGCFWLPQAPTKQKLLLINPPFWPGRTVKSRIIRRTLTYFMFWRHGYTLPRWLWRSGWGIYYGITELPRHHALGKQSSRYRLEAIIERHTALIIRNTADDWLTPNYKQLLNKHQGLSFAELPGDHDNCWINPEPYVRALKSFVGKA
ncbi:MAG TPA: hypothetical protein VGE30_03840 [Candidatus Saccharimonadales bacterium]